MKEVVRALYFLYIISLPPLGGECHCIVCAGLHSLVLYKSLPTAYCTQHNSSISAFNIYLLVRIVCSWVKYFVFRLVFTVSFSLWVNAYIRVKVSITTGYKNIWKVLRVCKKAI